MRACCLASAFKHAHPRTSYARVDPQVMLSKKHAAGTEGKKRRRESSSTDHSASNASAEACMASTQMAEADDRLVMELVCPITREFPVEPVILPPSTND